MSYSINFNLDNSGAAITNNLKAEARDPVTLALEAVQTFIAPHTFPLSIALIVDEAKVYLVRIVEVTGGGDVVRNEYVYDTSQQVFSTEPDIVWVVDRSGDDPVSGETEFEVPALEGIEFRLVKRGIGPLEPGVEFDYLESGGVKLLLGAEFEEEDTYFIQKYPPSTDAPRDLFLVVGRGQPQDPITGTDEYRYSPLAGKNYRVEKRGYGPMRSDEITIVSAGGFNLLEDALFEYEDTFVIHFYPTIILQTPNNSSAGKWFDGIIELTDASTTLDTSYVGKLIRFNGTGSTCKAVLPVGGTMPVNRILCFEHVRGNALFGTIETQAGQDIEFFWNDNVVLNDQVWIGKNEFMYLQWDGTKWIIINTNWAINEVGSFIDSYVLLPNTVEGDGAAPLRAALPRLWFIVDQFIAAALVAEVDAAANPGCYTPGDGATTFRLPNWDGKAAYAGPVGAYQADQVGQFTLDAIKARAGSHGGASDAEAGTVALLNNSGTTEVEFTIKGSGSLQQAGKETRVKRIGVLKLIRT